MAFIWVDPSGPGGYTVQISQAGTAITVVLADEDAVELARQLVGALYGADLAQLIRE